MTKIIYIDNKMCWFIKTIIFALLLLYFYYFFEELSKRNLYVKKIIHDHVRISEELFDILFNKTR